MKDFLEDLMIAVPSVLAVLLGFVGFNSAFAYSTNEKS